MITMCHLHPLSLFCVHFHNSGWFGTSELKAFDPVAAEKARSSLRTASHLRNALSEALDPSLLASRLSEAALDDYDDDEEEESLEQEVAPARKKATPKAKKAAKAEPAEKKRRASASDDQPAKGKPSKRAVPADDDEDEDEAPKVRTVKFANGGN